jgi:hypothetical protein
LVEFDFTKTKEEVWIQKIWKAKDLQRLRWMGLRISYWHKTGKRLCIHFGVVVVETVVIILNHFDVVETVVINWINFDVVVVETIVAIFNHFVLLLSLLSLYSFTFKLLQLLLKLQLSFFKSFIVPYHWTFKQHYIIYSNVVGVETIAIIFILAAVVVEIVVLMWLLLIHFTYLRCCCCLFAVNINAFIIGVLCGGLIWQLSLLL